VGLLSAYRVLDLADEKGILATRLLADMGAEIIRIEKPGINHCEESFDFVYANAGKKRISLDLDTEKGRELFRQLLKTADIMVETYQPGYLESLGLGYRQLSPVFPQLIMASVTGFGQSGPYCNFKADDLVLEALGGWLSVTGEPDAPLKLYGNQAYYMASLFAANGILLAIRERHNSGKGQHLDISVMECVAATLDHALPRFLSEGTVSGRQGSRHWNNAFRVFRCQDGYILLSLVPHWETLVEWLDSEGMAADLTDERWRDRDEKNRGIDHIIDVLERWTLTHTVAELEEKGQLMRFPWAGIKSIPQLLESSQLEERNYFTEIAIGDTKKKYRAPGTPVKMSGSPWRTGSRLAVPGESNHELYAKELGLTENEMDRLSGEGVI